LTEPTQNNEQRHSLAISELLEEIARLALDNKKRGKNAFASALNEYSQSLAESIAQSIQNNIIEEKENDQ
jgi:hypothetical protein